MRIQGWFHGLGGAFRRDRRGNFGMAMAVVAPVLMLGVGYGLNIAQISVTRANLLAALDSAVTSTARDLTTGAIDEADAHATVEAFLIANGLRAYAEEGRLTLDSLVVDKAERTLSARASVVLDVAFPLFGAANTRTITSESAALYSDRRIEVAMMLDVTGSMRGSKIEDLKSAARNAVNLLLDGQNGSRVRVALVPYAEAVNAGALAAGTVFVEKEGGPDLPPPHDDPFWVSVPSRPDNCAMERKLDDGTADFSDDSPYALRPHPDYHNRDYRALVNRDERLSRNRWTGEYACPKAELVPLTADKSKLLDSIRDFEPDGYTGGGIAAQWGYYMLSPNWRQPIRDAVLGDGPANHDRRQVAKVAILMTDGEFNTAFAGVPAGENPQMAQTARSRTNAESICTRMKQDGIEVYTIGFALPASESSNARGVLRNCASPDTGSIRHFFDVATGAELDAAFKEIIRNTERLALTK